MDLVRHFDDLLERDELPLAEAALVIAAGLQPDLSIEAELERLDLLAAEVPERTLAGVVTLLFDTMGFTGNRADYYDPRNSFLNCVLDRRTGIPISLSVLLIEIARRVDVYLVGVGMPGHFLVRDARDQNVFVDAFGGGARLSRTGCMELFRGMHGPMATFEESYLAPIPAAVILKRMLANLRNVFIERDDTRSLAWVLELNAHLPDSTAHDERELAIALSARGLFDRAAVAYERAVIKTVFAGEDPARDAALSLGQWARCN